MIFRLWNFVVHLKYRYPSSCALFFFYTSLYQNILIIFLAFALSHDFLDWPDICIYHFFIISCSLLLRSGVGGSQSNYKIVFPSYFLFSSFRFCLSVLLSNALFSGGFPASLGPVVIIRAAFKLLNPSSSCIRNPSRAFWCNSQICFFDQE